MRTQSAEVLNDADALERRMRWVEFQHEQDTVLYGGAEGEWRPGAPLHSIPTNRLLSIAREQQWCRPAAEILPNHFWSTRNKCWDWCMECEVGWCDDDDDHCWVCGAVVESQRNMVPDLKTLSGGAMHYVSTARVNDHEVSVRFSIDEFQIYDPASMIDMVSELTSTDLANSQAELYYWYMVNRDLGRAVNYPRQRGPRYDLLVIDEWAPTLPDLPSDDRVRVTVEGDDEYADVVLEIPASYETEVDLARLEWAGHDRVDAMRYTLDAWTRLSLPVTEQRRRRNHG